MDEERRLLDDRGYELGEPVLEDGWGRVYRARYLPHETPVLLRVFCAGLARSAPAWGLMAAEVRAWARLDHRGIIQPLDWGDVEGTCYLATVLPGGAPLSGLLGEDEGVPWAPAAFAALLESVEAARGRGILHLGLSPQNVWVDVARRAETAGGEAGPARTGSAPDSGHPGAEGSLAGEARVTAMVGEFGFWFVARDFPELRVPESGFPAPEQVSGGRASAASDVYSLGLLHLALAHGLSTARACASDPSAVPAGAHPALARCLDPHPLARSGSAGKMAQAFGISLPEGCERRDCPICRLKEQVQRERGASDGGVLRGGWTAPAGGPGKVGSAGCFWALVATIAVAAAIVWWMVLR